MTCQQALGMMQAFGDGELEADGRRLFVAHLRECPRCRREYDECRQLVNELATALQAEAAAPAGMAESVQRRLAAEQRLPGSVAGAKRVMGTRSFKVALSAGLVVALVVTGWFVFGQDLALAKAIDNALRQVKSAHFVAMEGGREIEVWATQDAERVTTDDGWMVAKKGVAYLYDARRKRVSLTHGQIAHLQMLRGLNVLLLSERLRGRVLGKPTVVKETITLADGRKAIRISAVAKARNEGVVCDYAGEMLVDPATNHILSGEASQTVPGTPEAGKLMRQGRLRSMRIYVDRIEYNVPVPKGVFDTTVPPGWRANFRE
jgi:hypothetical protein